MIVKAIINFPDNMEEFQEKVYDMLAEILIKRICFEDFHELKDKTI